MHCTPGNRLASRCASTALLLVVLESRSLHTGWLRMERKDTHLYPEGHCLQLRLQPVQLCDCMPVADQGFGHDLHCILHVMARQARHSNS